MDRKNAYEILNEKIDTIVKSIINGKGTDERLYELEMNYKLYSNQLKDLIEYDSLIKTKITDSNLLEFHNFTRFSPEKFSRKLGIDELEFRKQCRISCGAQHVIENVLPYLLSPE